MIKKEIKDRANMEPITGKDKTAKLSLPLRHVAYHSIPWVLQR